jgi:hypothetical protein
MVTRSRPLGWAPFPDLRWGRSPKLHAMQGVKPRRSWLSWSAINHAAEGMAMAGAIKTPSLAAWFGR